MREINRWRLWHYKATTADSLPSTLEETARPVLGLGMIDVKGYESIMAQAWGVGADNDTFGLNIYGWMENGPGELLIATADTTCLLGAHSFAADLLTQQNEPRLPTGKTWRACDTWGARTVEMVGATYAAGATAPVGAHIVIPTLGFKYLAAKITGLGAGAAADEIALLYRQTQRLREST